MSTANRRAGQTRDAAKVETRLALIQAGIAEFLENGLNTPSLDGICARAGYTRGAFYVHFQDRDDFVVTCMEWALGIVFDVIVAVDRGGAGLGETIDGFVGALTSGTLPLPLTTNRAAFTHYLADASRRSDRIRERMAQLIMEEGRRIGRAASQGQAARTVRSDVDPEQLGILLLIIASGVTELLELKLPIDIPALGAVVKRLVAPEATTTAPARKRTTTKQRPIRISKRRRSESTRPRASGRKRD